MVNEIAAKDPFCALVYIRTRTSCYIGRDKRYEFHKYLTSHDGKAIQIDGGKDFYVDLVIIPASTQSKDVELVKSIYDKVICGPDPGLPTELPSCLFKGKRQDDLVRFRWKGSPVELKLHQFANSSHHPLTFEMALACNEIGLQYVLFKVGGFDYKEDQDPELLVKGPLKGAMVFKVPPGSNLSGKVDIPLQRLPIDVEIWTVFSSVIVPNRKKVVRSFIYCTCPLPMQKVVQDEIQHQYFFNAASLERPSLKILAHQNNIFIMGKVEPLAKKKGVKYITPNKRETDRTVHIPIEKGTLLPNTIKASYTNEGLLIVAFSVNWLSSI